MERVVHVREEGKDHVRYYGTRKSDKLVRCYHKKQIDAYRVEVEFHSGLLRQHQIGSIDDLISLPDIVMPKHLRFVDFDWKTFERYLSRNPKAGGGTLLDMARKRRKSIHTLLAYLRRNGILTRIVS